MHTTLDRQGLERNNQHATPPTFKNAKAEGERQLSHKKQQ